MTKPPGIALYNQDRFGDTEFLASFVARSKQTKALLNSLRHIAKGGPTEHQILVGTRGMGKTSLLRRLSIGIMEDPELKAVFIPLRFREEQYNIISLDAFWRNCGESLAEYCEQQGNQALADELDEAIDTLEWRDDDKAREGGPSCFSTISI
jgi:predicted NACHT family NTPase